MTTGLFMILATLTLLCVGWAWEMVRYADALREVDRLREIVRRYDHLSIYPPIW